MHSLGWAPGTDQHRARISTNLGSVLVSDQAWINTSLRSAPGTDQHGVRVGTDLGSQNDTQTGNGSDQDQASISDRQVSVLSTDRHRQGRTRTAVQCKAVGRDAAKMRIPPPSPRPMAVTQTYAHPQTSVPVRPWVQIGTGPIKHTCEFA